MLLGLRRWGDFRPSYTQRRPAMILGWDGVVLFWVRAREIWLRAV